MAMEMLDREFREDQSAILSNEISRCMIQNNMTLENLDEACEIVREVFRKNATMITSVKLFIGISNLRSNYSCLTRTVSSNILSVKFGWKIIAVFCMYFIIAVNIWIDIKIVILHHDGTPFVVLGHASVLYLQYRGLHWATQQVQTVFHKL